MSEPDPNPDPEAALEPALEERLDAEGRLRPGFVLDFPKDAELAALVALFERGDFRALRERAPELVSRTKDAAIKSACEELLRRTRPDPTVKLLLLLSFAFFVFLTAWAYLH